MSLSGHQSPAMKSDTWLTPPEWIEALGPFDLDPCCPPNMPWRTAERMLTKADDGLAASWAGRVWCNPPFGRQASAWAAKMARHGNGCLLLAARTETAMFFDHVWPHAAAICFTGPGRPHFHDRLGVRAPHNSGAPITLIAYGRQNVAPLKRAGLGVVLEITTPTGAAP